MAKKQTKTNAMRQLEASGISYETLSYVCDGQNFDGVLVADQVGLPCAQVFKTLVTRGDKNEIVVCCIPVDQKLDRGALAATAGQKRLDLVPAEELLRITGYLRGGCSPVGMKKQYPTFIDASALDQQRIAVSAGLRGLQLLLAPGDLIRHTGAITGGFCMGGERENT